MTVPDPYHGVDPVVLSPRDKIRAAYLGVAQTPIVHVPDEMGSPLDYGAALVLLSGGQDSATCLFWALQRFSRVEALAFDYGQRHGVEIQQARTIARLAGVPLTVLPVVGLRGSALTDSEGGSTDASHATRPDLPAAFTPARNAVFLAHAANLAHAEGLGRLVIGVSAADEAGFPDCRDGFLRDMAAALSSALGVPMLIDAPLLTLSKAETWGLAHELGCLDAVVEHSHTDYYGDRTERHAWGYGRLDNPASRARAEGFHEAVRLGLIPDPDAPLPPLEQVVVDPAAERAPEGHLVVGSVNGRAVQLVHPGPPMVGPNAL